MNATTTAPNNTESYLYPIEQPVAAPDEWYAIIKTALIARETDKAILVNNDRGGVWLPKSQIHMLDLRGCEAGGVLILVIKGWLARKNQYDLNPAVTWIEGEQVGWINQDGYPKWFSYTFPGCWM